MEPENDELDEITDEALHAAYRHAGNQEAAEILYWRYLRRLRWFFARDQRTREEAEDLAHETLFAVFSIETIQGTEGFKRLVFRVASNKKYDFLRRKSRRPEGQRVPLGETEIREADGKTTPNAERTMYQQLLGYEVRRCWDALSPEQQEVYLLNEEGFSPTDIGRVLLISRQAAEGRLHRAYEGIRRCLETRREGGGR